MEYIIPVFVFKILQSFNRESFFIGDRVSIRSKHDTNCRIVFKLQIYFIQFTVYTRLGSCPSSQRPSPEARSTLKPLIAPIAMPITHRNRTTEIAEPMPISSRPIEVR